MDAIVKTELTTEQEAQRDAFIERLLEASAGVFTIFTTYLDYT